ncbi:hypothetical protein E0765_06115 [Sulfuricurvum sp. IAE1]|uniref:hypothetical protein n=1 Tax=Sulfuricurvum sp. IAE1 TaxID=2546102 RepID=UPI00104AE2A2|nr:hypothetical protein [Sulfuricurvum sp. IAE1]TDA64287.1 hypothetical protein E0765_06115 [Sulfuricurvum sp. IAE1]
MATLIQELTEVKAAIKAVLTSQSYEMEGRKLTRADLEMLQAREDRLEDKIRKYGPNYDITQEQVQARRGIRVKKAVW